MKKNTIFPNLLQKIISEEELSDIQPAFGYKDTARKLDVLTLVNYLVCASVNEFKSYQHCADVGFQYGLPQIDHSTLFKKGKSYGLPRRFIMESVQESNYMLVSLHLPECLFKSLKRLDLCMMGQLVNSWSILALFW